MIIIINRSIFHINHPHIPHIHISIYPQSYSHPLKLLLPILNNTLQNSLSQIMLTQISSQMCNILISITHQIRQYCMIYSICFPPQLHTLCILKIYPRCIYLKLPHTLFQIRIIIRTTSNPNHPLIKII